MRGWHERCALVIPHQRSTINHQLLRNFSVKEKDEASPPRVCAPGFAECLHSPFCREMKAFLFLSSASTSSFSHREPGSRTRTWTRTNSSLRSGLSINTRSAGFPAELIERSAHEKSPCPRAG